MKPRIVLPSEDSRPLRDGNTGHGVESPVNECLFTVELPYDRCSLVLYRGVGRELVHTDEESFLSAECTSSSVGLSDIRPETYVCDSQP